MKFFKKQILENLLFFSLLICYFVLGCFVVLLVRKGDDVVWLNQFHQPFADFFFKYFTHIGDGLFCVLVSLVFLTLKKYKNALLIFLTFALSGLLSQFFKKFVFPDLMRPTVYLANEKLHLVDGVEIMTRNSFPSGHTTTAFACFFMLALIFKDKTYSILFFISALLVSISRVYLCQHFFADTYAGAWLGTISTITIYSLVYTKLRN
jgi:membrane-associated phospholipid phosphatase